MWNAVSPWNGLVSISYYTHIECNILNVDIYMCMTVLLPVSLWHIALWHYPRCSCRSWISRGRLRSQSRCRYEPYFLGEIIRAFISGDIIWGIKKKRFCAILGLFLSQVYNWGIKKGILRNRGIKKTQFCAFHSNTRNYICWIKCYALA